MLHFKLQRKKLNSSTLFRNNLDLLGITIFVALENRRYYQARNNWRILHNNNSWFNIFRIILFSTYYLWTK